MSSVFYSFGLDDVEPPLVHLCPNCEGDLEVHEPDEDLPDRFLATCPACKSWFLMDSDANLTDLPPVSDG